MNISHDIRIRNLDLIADSGATLKCFCMNSPSNYDKQIEPIRALLTDRNKINTHIQCKIIMDGLPEQLKTPYKFDKIQEPLMSIPVLCDNRCTVKFTKQSVHVNKYGKTILTGYREPATKLWRFPQAANTPPSGKQVEPRINALITDGIMRDTLNFLHRSMGSPTKTTLLNSIRNNNISTWPFFTENNIAKFLPDSIPTALGQQDQTRKNSQSTQQSTYKTPGNKYINIYAAIDQPEISTGKIHSDQTGQFPI